MRTPDDFEADFRAAAGAGEFARAHRIWESYVGDLRRTMAAGGVPSGDALTRIDALIEWTRNVVLASRSQISDEIARLDLRLRYAEGPVPRRPMIRFSG